MNKFSRLIATPARVFSKRSRDLEVLFDHEQTFQSFRKRMA